MKTSAQPFLCAFIAMILLASPLNADLAAPAIVERGPHHRVWVNVTAAAGTGGQTVLRTNRYTELANGTCYQNQNGEWLDSREVIEIVPGGGALASQGAHRVEFSANVNTRGAINMVTPDGKRLRSHVLGLAYTDARTGRRI